MQEFLYDIAFLEKIRKLKLRSQYARLELLNFQEELISQVEGKITQGSISINGNSDVRRTINLTMVADEFNNDLENVNNLISIKRKLRAYVGILNPFPEYDRILWFPCGMFVLATAKLTRQTNSMTIAITGKDKMCLLDGSMGGTLYSTVEFHVKEEKDEEGKITYTYPSIYEIIQESLVHYGQEKLSNIIISDLSKESVSLQKYLGDKSVYINFNKYVNNDINQGLEIVFDSDNIDIANYIEYQPGEEIGITPIIFRYPGELVFKAGNSLTQVFKKICELLTNYEYFYNLNGQFVFQEKKNFLNISELSLLNIDVNNYIQIYTNQKASYDLTNEETLISINSDPKYENIKNDFVVWGKRKTDNGVEVDIRYRLVIDNKPPLQLAKLYMYEIKLDNKIIDYQFLSWVATAQDYEGWQKRYGVDEKNIKLIAIPCNEWREEMYRQILIGNAEYAAYEMDMIAEWRKLFDTINDEWKDNNYWNPDVSTNPQKLNYWIDFIDTNSEITQFAVSQIGRRAKVVENNSIGSIMNKQIEELYIFFASDDKLPDRIENSKKQGQQFVIIPEEYEEDFTMSSQKASAFDEIRNLLYQHLIYQTQVNLTMLPEYNLEPNGLIYINIPAAKVVGNFVINSINLPLQHNGTMTIQASRALTKV